MTSLSAILSVLIIAGQMLPTAEAHHVGTGDGACCCAPVEKTATGCCSAPVTDRPADNCDCRITEDGSLPLLATSSPSLAETGPRHPPLLLLVLTASDLDGKFGNGIRPMPREHHPPDLGPPAGRTACVVFCSYRC